MGRAVGITLAQKEVSVMGRARQNRPGKEVPRSGQYELTGRKGAGLDREFTLVKGEPFPPTPKSGQSFRLVDKTKHTKD